jgi:hydroxymethylpyrimidine pyrophosphatase-like HAD family hydrolase
MNAKAVDVRTRVVVVADLDGTLAFGNRPPGPEVSAVLRAVVEHPEMRLVLASSRPPPAIRRLMGAFADDADLVACNGAMRVSRDGNVGRTSLCALLVADLLTALATEAFCLDYGDRFLASTPGALPWMGTTERSVLGRFGPQTGVLKVSTANDRPHARISRVVEGRAEVIRHEFRGDLEVVPRGMNKSVGLNELLGTDRPPVIALGNDTNDLELLRDADRGIVVGDGLRELDALAHVQRVGGHDRTVGQALMGSLGDLIVA